MTNPEIIKAIEIYQAAGTNPLLCGNFWKHENELLIPVLIEDKVYLECSKCNYLQETIPECVIEILKQAA